MTAAGLPSNIVPMKFKVTHPEATTEVDGWVPDAHWVDEHFTIYIVRAGFGDGKADKWSIVDGAGNRMSRSGKWGREPLPSERTDKYLRARQFTFDEAVALAQNAIAKKRGPVGRGWDEERARQKAYEDWLSQQKRNR